MWWIEDIYDRKWHIVVGGDWEKKLKLRKISGHSHDFYWEKDFKLKNIERILHYALLYA